MSKHHYSPTRQNELVAEFQGLATSIACQYYHKVSRLSGIELDDLKQEAYVALIGAAARADSSKDKTFAAYMMECVRGAIMNYAHRKLPWRSTEIRKRHPDEPDILMEGQSLDDWQKVVGRDLAGTDDLGIFQEMPISNKRDRLLLILRYHEGLTFTEIADQLGLSRQYVRILHARAIETLKTWKTEELTT